MLFRLDKQESNTKHSVKKAKKYQSKFKANYSSEDIKESNYFVL